MEIIVFVELNPIIGFIGNLFKIHFLLMNVLYINNYFSHFFSWSWFLLLGHKWFYLCLRKFWLCIYRVDTIHWFWGIFQIGDQLVLGKWRSWFSLCEQISHSIMDSSSGVQILRQTVLQFWIRSTSSMCSSVSRSPRQ